MLTYLKLLDNLVLVNGPFKMWAHKKFYCQSFLNVYVNVAVVELCNIVLIDNTQN